MDSYDGLNRRNEASKLVLTNSICKKISDFLSEKPHIHWGKLTEIANSINNIETTEEARVVLAFLEAFSKAHSRLILLFLEKISPLLTNHIGKEIIALLAISDIEGKSEIGRNTILNALGFELGESFRGIRERFPREHTEVQTLVSLVRRLALITEERHARLSKVDGRRLAA